MALYEFICSTCHNHFELMRPMSEAGKPAACPACNAEAQRIISGLDSQGGNPVQAPRIAPSKRAVSRASRRKAKAARAAKKRTVLRASSDADRKTGYRSGPFEERFREEMELWRSTSSSTAQATAVIEEGVAVDSEVESQPVAAPVEMSWLADYQPSGGNMWFIQDWGIASMLGYLRNKEETESTEGRPGSAGAIGIGLAEADEDQDRVVGQQAIVAIEPEIAVKPAEAADAVEVKTQPAEADEHAHRVIDQQTVVAIEPEITVKPAEAADAVEVKTQPAEADEHAHRVIDQQTVVAIEPEVPAGATEATDRRLPDSEPRTVVSVRPWPEGTVTKPAEADEDHADSASRQSDVDDIERRSDEAIPSVVQAAGSRDQMVEEGAASAARHSRPTERIIETEFPDQILKAAWRRQGGRCAKCGRWLIWPFRNRDGGTGAWESHHRIPEDQGGGSTLANCVLFCSGVADCHFRTGHGGVGWSHHAPLEDSELVFLRDVSKTATDYTAPTRPKRSLLRAVLGISQPQAPKGLPVAD